MGPGLSDTPEVLRGQEGQSFEMRSTMSPGLCGRPSGLGVCPPRLYPPNSHKSRAPNRSDTLGIRTPILPFRALRLLINVQHWLPFSARGVEGLGTSSKHAPCLGSVPLQSSWYSDCGFHSISPTLPCDISQLLPRLSSGKLLQPGHLSSTEDKPIQRRSLPHPTLLHTGENRILPPLCREPSRGLQAQLTIHLRTATVSRNICKGLLRPLVSSRPHWGLENF